MLCNPLKETINPSPWVDLAQNEYTDSNQIIPWYLDTTSSRNWINKTRFSNKRTRFEGENVDDTEMFPLEFKEHPTYNAFDNDIGIINVFFVDKETSRYITSNTHSTFDFVAEIGGSLGFLMGVSVASVVEILYWISLWVWRILK